MRSSERPLRALRRLVRTSALEGSAVLLLATTAVLPAEAQSRALDAQASPASIVSDAQHAYRSGHYDTVEQLVGPLAASDPDAALLHARAAAARGRYDEALARLRPLAAADCGGPGALELGLLQRSLGRRAEAEPVLEAVIRRASRADGAATGRAARAAHALGRVQQANDLFRDAAAMVGDDPELQTAWGDLLVEKHQNADAARSYRAAIQADRGYAPAYVGLGEAMADTDPPMARQLVERALTLNTSLVAAHVFVAELALNDRDTAAAASAIDRALAVNPSSLDARALQAAVAWIEDSIPDFEAHAAAALAINPRFGAVYRIAGTHAARHYRFEDAVALTRKGLTIDPEDTRAYAELGLHLLRTGDEPGARSVLERAFRDDPYDIVTYNLLALLDTLDTFVTVQDGPLTFRLHPDEAAVLREHAIPLAHAALNTLGERYGLTPQGPSSSRSFPGTTTSPCATSGCPA